MKQLLLSFLIVSASAGAGAQQSPYAMLKLRLSDGAPLSVNIDGQFIDRNTSILRLDGIEPGQHKIEVYRNRANNRKPKRIFTGTIPLDGGTVYIGLVDLYSQRLRMKTRPYDPRRDGAGGTAAADSDMPATGAAGDGFGSFPKGKDAESARPDFSRNAVPAGIIAPARMTTLEKQVMAKQTESDRLDVLKKNLMSARVSVAQLDKMMGWLNFESSRLELSDWMRSRVADRANMPQLTYRFSLEENQTAFRKQLEK